MHKKIIKIICIVVLSIVFLISGWMMGIEWVETFAPGFKLFGFRGFEAGGVAGGLIGVVSGVFVGMWAFCTDCKKKSRS